jgi:hypothetical protein
MYVVCSLILESLEQSESPQMQSIPQISDGHPVKHKPTATEALLVFVTDSLGYESTDHQLIDESACDAVHNGSRTKSRRRAWQRPTRG